MKHASEKAPTATSKGIQTGTETVPQIQIRKCPTCDKGFRTKRGVKAHIKAVHAAQAKRSEQGAKEENRAVAKQSASASLEPGTIDTPKEEENNDVAENTLADNPGSKKVTEKQKPYCRACNKPFRSQAALEGHERLKHKKNIPRPAQNQESNYEEAFPYACHACGKSFRLESALADHNANKHDFGRACLPTSYSRPVVYHPDSAYNLYDSDDEGYTDDDSDDDSDDMYNSDDSYDSDDPLGKYKYDSFDDWANNYGEVSASYLAQYGY